MDIDFFLEIIENSTRREILKKLIEKKCYPLLLSRELNLTQQAVMKHLAFMEKSKIVKVCGYEKNINGPPRKIYTLEGRYSLTVDLTPNLFYIDIKEIPKINYYDTSNKELRELLDEIDKELKRLEQKRLRLLSIKDYLLSMLR